MLLFSGIAIAGEVQIKGAAPDYPTRTVELYIYDDYITYKEKKIAQAEVDENGAFQLSASMDETQYAFLRIGTQFADFFMEKDGAYEVRFPAPIKNTEAVNQFTERHYQKLEIENATIFSLNPSIARFNKMYDDFLEENRYSIMRGSLKDRADLQTKLKAFRAEVEEKFAAVHGEFFKTHLDYSFAQLEQITLVSDQHIFEKYFADGEIHYRNYEYMNYFNQFFEKRVELFALSSEGRGFMGAVNAGVSLPAIDDFLKKDKFLQDKLIRRLLLVKACRSFYYKEGYRKSQVVKLLKKIEQENFHEEVVLAAKNMRQILTKLNVGSPAPDIALRNSNNIPTKLSDFKGKYIYLEFTDATCPTCNLETRIIG